MADTPEASASTNLVSQSRSKLAKSLMDSSEIEPKKVLVIYTGGTIGMKTNEKGGLEKKKIVNFFPQSNVNDIVKLFIKKLNLRAN